MFCGLSCGSLNQVIYVLLNRLFYTDYSQTNQHTDVRLPVDEPMSCNTPGCVFAVTCAPIALRFPAATRWTFEVPRRGQSSSRRDARRTPCAIVHVIVNPQFASDAGAWRNRRVVRLGFSRARASPITSRGNFGGNYGGCFSQSAYCQWIAGIVWVTSSPRIRSSTRSSVQIHSGAYAVYEAENWQQLIGETPI